MSSTGPELELYNFNGSEASRHSYGEWDGNGWDYPSGGDEESAYAAILSQLHL